MLNMGHSLGGALAGLIGSTGAGVAWGDAEAVGCVHICATDDRRLPAGYVH